MKEKMFAGYPDVVNVDQLREMLGGIGYKAAYGLLHDGSIRFFKIGKAFRIPKINIIEYLQRNSEIYILLSVKIKSCAPLFRRIQHATMMLSFVERRYC